MSRPPLKHPLLQFFERGTVPLYHEDIARQFAAVADAIVDCAPLCPETTVALRKLLEARDATLRARVYDFGAAPDIG